MTAGHGRSDMKQWGLPGKRRSTFVASAAASTTAGFMPEPRPGSRPSLQARLVAVTLAGQGGRVLGDSQAERGVP